MNNTPLISVILPVYNAAGYVEESIQSILNQTCENFELIIIDDGSNDNSGGLIKNIKDARIRFYSQPNMGLAKTLNKGIELANGEFIARQDADDISMPERFEKQIQFLIANPEVNLLGTWAEIFPVKNNVPRFHKHPANDSELKFELFFDCPFVHSSVMLRKECLKTTGYYNPEKTAEDFDLWARIARSSKVANIPDVLLRYREVAGGLSKAATTTFANKVAEQSIENIAYFIPGKYYEISQMVKLYHGLYEEFDGKVSILEMTGIINSLIELIAENNLKEKDLLIKKAEGYITMLRYRQNFCMLQKTKGSIFVNYYYRLINRLLLKKIENKPNSGIPKQSSFLAFRNKIYRVRKKLFRVRKSITKELIKERISYKQVLSKSHVSLLDNGEYFINIIIAFKGRPEFYEPIVQSFNNAIKHYQTNHGEKNKFCLTFVEQSPQALAKVFFESKTNYIWTPGNHAERFNKSLAYNMGVKYSNKAEYYLLHDLDILVKENFLEELLSNLQNNKCLQPYGKRRVLYLSQALTEQVLRGKINCNGFSENTEGVSLPDKLGSPGGSILVERDLYQKVGGFDPELFWGYAPEDIMFWEKIVTINGAPAYADNPPIDMFHMWHPPTNFSNPLILEMNDIFLQFKKMNKTERLKIIETQRNNFIN